MRRWCWAIFTFCLGVLLTSCGGSLSHLEKWNRALNDVVLIKNTKDIGDGVSSSNICIKVGRDNCIEARMQRSAFDALRIIYMSATPPTDSQGMKPSVSLYIELEDGRSPTLKLNSHFPTNDDFFWVRYGTIELVIDGDLSIHKIISMQEGRYGNISVSLTESDLTALRKMSGESRVLARISSHLSRNPADHSHLIPESRTRDFSGQALDTIHAFDLLKRRLPVRKDRK